MYKGAIFDMDGILFDTEQIYQDTWHEIADEMNVTLPFESNKFLEKYSPCRYMVSPAYIFAGGIFF